MKLLVLMFSILLPLLAHTHELPCVSKNSTLDLPAIAVGIRALNHLSNDPKFISQEAKSLSCDPKTIARGIVEQKPGMVPSRLHHFGQRKLLDEDILERNIPKKAWDKFIMGDESRWQHGDVRRGLYGTAGIGSNMFGQPNAFAFKNDWLIEIVVNEACRRPESVVTLDILSEDPRFQNWFKKQSERAGFNDILQYQSECDGKIAMTGFLEPRCDSLVERFLREQKILIVQDHQMTKSFYVRERSCITSILGSPNEMLELLANRDYWWAKTCDSDFPSSYIPYYLAASLKQAALPVKETTLEKIEENISLLAQENLKPELRNLLDSFRRCQKSGELSKFRQKINEQAIRLNEGGFFWNAETVNCRALSD